MHRYSIVEEGIPVEKAVHALILLHGRGGSAEDILILADEFCDDSFYIAAPQATGNSWYPESFLKPEERNEPWLSSALDIVRRLTDDISGYIPTGRVYIMGFSQGACLALEFAAKYPAGYAGVAAFSGGLIGDVIRPEKYAGYFPQTKIFLGNSDTDPHIPLSRAEESAGFLRKMGADVLFRVWPGMEHTITGEEIESVKRFMF